MNNEIDGIVMNEIDVVMKLMEGRDSDEKWIDEKEISDNYEEVTNNVDIIIG